MMEERRTAASVAHTPWLSSKDLADELSSPSSNGYFELFVFVALVASIILVSSQIQARAEQQRRKRLNDKDKAERLLSREHVDLVVQRKWKEIMAWIVFEPAELHFLDKNGQSILHHACLFRAPAEVIQMILWQAPDLASTPNPDMELPLHWSVRLSSPNEHISELLAACPSSGTWNSDKDGNTPLTLLWDRHKEAILQAWWSGGRSRLRSLHAWKRVMLFFPCQEHGEIAVKTPLHVASCCPCPPGFYSLLLQVFEEALGRCDHHGRLPLHYACLNAHANISSDVQSKIQALLRAYPQASKCVDRDGRTPFHLALESGVCWEEGLKELWETNPIANPKRDPVTLLPHFLLAATAQRKRVVGPAEKQDSNNENDGENYAASLSTIYTLLRTDPSSLGPS